MSINLDNAQFRAFQALADDAKLGQDTLVSVDETWRGKGLLNEAGESRKIVVKKGDTIRPLFGRSREHVDLNNEVRRQSAVVDGRDGRRRLRALAREGQGIRTSERRSFPQPGS